MSVRVCLFQCPNVSVSILCCFAQGFLPGTVARFGLWRLHGARVVVIPDDNVNRYDQPAALAEALGQVRLLQAPKATVQLGRAGREWDWSDSDVAQIVEDMAPKLSNVRMAVYVESLDSSALRTVLDMGKCDRHSTA